MADITTFPSGGQYLQALYNTSVAFQDPVLRGGDPAVDPLGMPKAISGNFASVFTICGTDGRRWAVKCFTRYVGDQAVRYQQISKTLRGIASPWKVDFEYLTDGVLCEGTWYPVLKMEWIEATGLLPFVEAHLGDPGALADLARKFENLVHDLSRNGIAHGDLQHGNILVTPSGELKLIDYDGMFVPGLDALGASELGHANYQSPLRTATHWGPEIDRFSSWVIYASLRALALEPGLWPMLHAQGDEALLFHKGDFSDPDNSRVRSLLTISSVPEVREIAKDIDFLWAQDLAAVPPLAALFGRGSAPAVGSRPTVPSRNPSSAAWTADWLQQAAPVAMPQGSVSGTAASQGNPIGTAAWLTTHMPIAPFADFTRPATFIRVAGGLILGFIMMFVVLAGVGSNRAESDGFSSLAVGGLILFWAVTFVSYEFSPVRREKRRIRRNFGERKRVATRKNRSVARLENEVRRLGQEADDFKSKTTKKADKARADEQRELADVEKKSATEIAKLDREINALPGKRDAEERNALSIVQKSHVDQRLQTARIGSARIPGIGPALTSTLAAHGISTASDFTGVRGAYLILRNGRSVSPSGIGVAKAQSLDIWRRSVENSARLTQPTSLPKPQRDAILDKYAQKRKSFESTKQAASVQVAKQKAEVKQKWDKSHHEIAKELSKGVARLTCLRTDKEASLTHARKEADTATLQRDYARRELARYRRIRYRRYLRRMVTG